MEIGEIIASLKLDITDFVRAVQEARQRAGEISLPRPEVEGIEVSKRKMLEFATAMNAVGNRLMAIGTGIVTSLSAILYTAARAGDAMYEYSLRTGIAVENLSALQYAAEQTGTDINALLWSFKFLQRQLTEASLGTERARERFSTLGIAITDATGKMRPAMDILFDIADSLSALSTQQEKAGYASRVFGLRYGPALVPMLSQGRRALEELMQQARDLNIVMSTEAAVALDAFKDSLITLRYALMAIGREMAVAMSPVIQAFSDIASHLAAMVSRFISAHPVMSRFATSLALISGGILVAVGSFARLISFIARMRTEIGGLVAALKLLSSSIITLMHNPIILAVGAVVALSSAYLVLSQRIDSFASSIRNAAKELRTATDTGSIEAMASALEEVNRKIEEGYRALEVWERRLEVLRRLGPMFFSALIIGEAAYARARREIGRAEAEALIEMVQAQEAYRSKMEEVMSTQLEEKGLTSDVVARYMVLSRNYDELGARIDAVQMAMKALNEEFDRGRISEKAYSAINEALGNILEETGNEFTRVYSALRDLRSLYPEVEEAAESFRQELSLSIMTTVEYYNAVNKVFEALVRAYDIQDEQLIGLRTRMLEAFEGTKAEEKALEDLISDVVNGITKSRSEMKRANEEMERLADRARDIREEYNRSIDEANRRYRESVIELANRIREAYELQLEVPKIADFTAALDFINTIIDQKSREANRLFELAHLERERILALSNSRLVDAEREFVEQMVKIDREYTRRQQQIATQFANLREQLISVLDRFYDFRDIVKMSDAALARLAERVRRGEVYRAAPESAVEKQYREWYTAVQSIQSINEQRRQIEEEMLALEEERLERETELRSRIVDEANRMRIQLLGFSEDLADFNTVLMESISKASDTFTAKAQEIIASAGQIIQSFEESGIKLSMLSQALERIAVIPEAKGYEGLQNLLSQLKSMEETLPGIQDLSRSIQQLTGARILLDTSVFMRQIEDLRRLLDSIPSEKVVRVRVVREVAGISGAGNLRDAVIDNSDEFINSIF